MSAILSYTMKKDKSGIDKFKDEMGFKDCSEVENNSLVDYEFIGRGKEKVLSSCRNYKDEGYQCNIVIDSKNKKVIKSDCEKILEKND